jgi:hypothetical protein
MQLVFRMGGVNLFAVGFRGELGHDELKAQLNRANRQLWDKEKDEPSAEYRAITGAAQALAQIGDLSMGKPVEPRSMLRMYDALRNLLACCKNAKKLSTAWTVYEQLWQEASEQAPTFFDAVTESPKVRRLKNAGLKLALELERPPTKCELRDRSGWTQQQQKEFNAALRAAGLAWLPLRWGTTRWFFGEQINSKTPELRVELVSVSVWKH